MEPELSVIVPVLDESKYLEATLASIADQNTNKPYELIVSDNGSTDGSVEIALRFTDRVVHCEERGIGPARHFGALNANENKNF